MEEWFRKHCNYLHDSSTNPQQRYRALLRMRLYRQSVDLAGGHCLQEKRLKVDSGGHSYEEINKNKGVFSNEC
jgi:hypothetical protein